MSSAMNTQYRKHLAGTSLDYFDTREAVDAIAPGAYAKLPYTSRVLAEQLVRRCEPELLTDSLKQLIERKRDLDFPWYPARVVCHDILGQRNTSSGLFRNLRTFLHQLRLRKIFF